MDALSDEPVEHHRHAIADRPIERKKGEQRLRERGAIRLTAIVAEDEAEAMRFWRAVGYERQQRRARFVRHLDG
jgi:hypothetical protein